MRSILGIIYEGSIQLVMITLFINKSGRKDNTSDFRMKEYLPGKLISYKPLFRS